MKYPFRFATPGLWVAVALVMLAPLPEGSAYPWALAILEAVIFGWAALALLAGVMDNRIGIDFSRGGGLAAPVVLFLTLGAIQLVPLPPALLRAISPGTYGLYKSSLSRWPQERAPGELPGDEPSRTGATAWSILPTTDEVAAGISLPYAPAARKHAGAQRPHQLDAEPASSVLNSWRTLSIAPSMSSGVLLEASAFAALFFLVLLSPFGGRDRWSVSRTIIVCAVASGLIAAVVGLVEFFDWNGKILWVFVPYDWGTPQPGALARALGPFVNPDHFGDYLAMVVPLAAGGAIFRTKLPHQGRAYRVFSAVALFMIVCALLLSLSRGAWIASAVALAVLFALSARIPTQARPGFFGLGRERSLCLAIAVAAALILFSLLFIGPQGREQVDLRLQETVYNDSGLRGRLELAADTLAMVRDYPVLGIGLGCWPELFPHYRRPPWSAVMYREVHNDYVQVLAETGVVGFALLSWFFIILGQRVYRAWMSAAAARPVLAMFCAAFAAVMIHELFDFSLHTPANAVLFIVLLAIAARTADEGKRGVPFRPNLRLRGLMGCVSAGAAVLALCALAQEKIPYPYSIERPASRHDALALISAHPAESAPHVELVQLAGQQLTRQRRLCELREAVWLDPTNPYPRDLYARMLMRQGSAAPALADIAQSLTDSPSLSTHFYLTSRLIPWLSSAESGAVERGLLEAVRRGYGGAPEGLAGFYEALGRFAEAAAVYRNAAEKEGNPQRRQEYLFGAAMAYAQAQDLRSARISFRLAISNAPTDARPYVYLTTMVLGPRHQLTEAQKVINEGVRAGADPIALYEALASEAQAEGDAQMAEAAFRDAVESRPGFDTLMRLGLYYLNQKNYGRAALNLRRATGMNAGSAKAYFELGIAEENDYRFSEAERDFSRAVRLAPRNSDYQAHYVEFERKVTRGLADLRAADR